MRKNLTLIGGVNREHRRMSRKADTLDVFAAEIAAGERVEIAAGTIFSV